MNTNILSSLAFAVAALVSSQTLAADSGTPLDREQVRAELGLAQQAGDVIADNESGRTLREVYPDRYPILNAPTKSRAEVMSELVQAQRDGTVIVENESGRIAREVTPSAYSHVATPAGQGLTREEVRAQLRAAQASGDIVGDNESGKTLRELYPSRYPNRPAQHMTREQVKTQPTRA